MAKPAIVDPKIIICTIPAKKKDGKKKEILITFKT